MALGGLNHQARFVREDLFVDLSGQFVRAADMDDEGIGADVFERFGKGLAQANSKARPGAQLAREIQFGKVSDEVAGLGNGQRQQSNVVGGAERAGGAVTLGQLTTH